MLCRFFLSCHLCWKSTVSYLCLQIKMTLWLNRCCENFARLIPTKACISIVCSLEALEGTSWARHWNAINLTITGLSKSSFGWSLSTSVNPADHKAISVRKVALNSHWFHCTKASLDIKHNLSRDEGFPVAICWAEITIITRLSAGILCFEMWVHSTGMYQILVDNFDINLRMHLICAFLAFLMWEHGISLIHQPWDTQNAEAAWSQDECTNFWSLKSWLRRWPAVYGFDTSLQGCVRASLAVRLPGSQGCGQERHVGAVRF